MYKITEDQNYCGLDFHMELTESKDQTDLFTKDHTKFDGFIEVKGQRIEFPYQCNLSFTEPEMEDVLSSLLLDKMSYDMHADDIDGFANEFGITSVSECIRTYESCKSISEKLDSIFTKEELEALDDLEQNTEELEER